MAAWTYWRDGDVRLQHLHLPRCRTILNWNVVVRLEKVLLMVSLVVRLPFPTLTKPEARRYQRWANRCTHF